MKIRNYSIFIKLKQFGLGYLIAISVFIFIKLYKVGFDFKMLEISTFDIFLFALISAIPAFQMNKVKYVVSQIDNKDNFIEWLYKYFEEFNGKVIHRINDLIIFEVVENSKGLFNKKRKSYFRIKIKETKATVEGPSYRKPIAIAKDSF